MGIKDLNALLKEYCPNYTVLITLKDFANKKIAIDANLYMNSIISVAFKEYVLSMPDPLEEIELNEILKKTVKAVLQFNVKVCEYNITPVWVWDGKSHPEKSICKKKRVATKDSSFEKLRVLKDMLLPLNPIIRVLEKEKEMLEYKKILSNSNIMNQDIMMYIKEIITNLGYPSITATTEAEKLCASLSRENLVDAVWSKDTDNYPLGSKITITKIEGLNKEGDIVLECGILSRILDELDKPFEWLVDLCIMLGCDFNTNIKGVGKVGCWKLMNKYGSIEEIELNETKYDCSVLNYVRCRELFEYEPSEVSESQLVFDMVKFTEMGEDILDQYCMLDFYAAIERGGQRISGAY